MRLRKRIQRLEQRWGQTQFPELTIQVMDRILNGTITDEEFVRYVPALERTGLLQDFTEEGEENTRSEFSK